MRKTNRRSFTRTITAVAATVPFLDVLAEDPPSPTAKALSEVVRSEFGQFLADEDMERVRKDFQDSAAGLKRLRDVKLANSDEPDFTFSPLTKRW